VYISYLDEAGLSKHETYLVVAGIVVPDNEMLKGEAALERILKKRIPEADHGRFEFHAHSLFTGNYFIKRHLIGGNELAEKIYQYFEKEIKESTVFP